MKVVGDIAFENFTEEKPTMLWRVVWWRTWGKDGAKRLRCTDYFSDQAKAWEFVGIRTDTGNEVVSVEQFELKPVASSACSTLEPVVAATSSESTGEA
jgi:hypothetical protein